MIDFLDNILLSKNFVCNLYNAYSLYFTNSVILEQNIEYVNLSSKKCDIVVFMNNKLYIIFTVKLIMINYKKKNRYNYFFYFIYNKIKI